MSDKIITLVFILVGALAGRTITLGSSSKRVNFIDGKCTIKAPEKEMGLIANWLSQWQALPEGDPRIDKLNEEIKNGISDLSPDGEAKVPGNVLSEGAGADKTPSPDGGATNDDSSGKAPVVANGDGQPNGLNTRLMAAIMTLDPADDKHWTADGRPAMKAVEAAYGSAAVTRADVEANSPPGFNREVARAAATQA